MSRIAIAFSGPRQVELVEEEAVAPARGEVRLRTLYSGISAGTELTAYRGSNPYLHKRWDAARRLFVDNPDNETHRYPVIGWGYEEVGEVVETGASVEGVPLGSLVFGTWGHRSETAMEGDDARERILSPGIEPITGVFSQIGAIALNGVLDADARPGDVVAVFGLGIVGQLVSQLLTRAGTRVIGVDILPARLEIARRLGTADTIDATALNPGETIKDMTSGRGADVCIEASGSTSVLGEAIRACAYSSQVVAIGFYQGESRGLFLGEEFHHNRISIICSQISGVAPHLQHRWSRPRLVRSFMDMVERGDIQVEPLVSHVVPVARAAEAFDLLDTRPGDVLQAVLDFREPAASNVTEVSGL